ncbi:MAG: RpiB/LacA/LacB family sugar-phosphate isomerase [Chloroflexi bacterium]|nr:MAG: RpiB/LacA/LacB family sugar-phosphate isomerase [Chloroflexota bacterium]MBL1196775.1 RpiB/LacA/LacB family sugar-phosphate isomerase [Chloroflexota bacterium]NOH14069.1 RpiB/LacA/LacB family sugar-phosphate isomerase [Chloroflexota bacterium]
MKISLGADERLHVVDVVIDQLKQDGHEVQYHGPESGATQPWPEVARLVAQDVVEGRSQEGILFCWTGTGVSIAANKVPGIRAALCADGETARGARLWNNANVLCMSMRLSSEVVAKEILEKWFATSYKPNKTDDACLILIDELDQQRQ